MKQDLAALTIHGRTTKELSKVEVHWDEYAKIAGMRDKLAPDTKIFLNGDINSYAEAHEYIERFGFDGAMLGRAIFKDPYVFSENSPWPNTSKADKIALYTKHINDYMDEWGTQKNPAVLKRFAKVYANGFDGASELRTSLMATNNGEELLRILQKY